MAYSVKADFEKRFPVDKLVKITRGSGTTVNETNLDEAIATADELIDSYLSSVINEDSLPLAAPPAFIKEYSVVIAVKGLSKGIQYNQIPDWVMKEYESAINHLKDISMGKANIKVDTETVTVNDKIEYDEDAITYFTRASY